MWNEEDHPREPKGTSGGGRFIARVNNADELVDYVRMVLNGEEVPQRVAFGGIGERERTAIETLIGEPLNANCHTIAKTEIIHINKDHGGNGRTDRSMSDLSDYGKILDAIQGFDEIKLLYKNGEVKRSWAYRDKYNKGARLVQFKKKMDNDNFYVVEMLTDGKDGDIKVLSAYQNAKK